MTQNPDAGLTTHDFRPFDAGAVPGADPLHPPYGHATAFDQSAVTPETEGAAQTDPTLSRYSKRANRRDLGIDGDIRNTAGYAEPPTAAIAVTPTADISGSRGGNGVSGVRGVSPRDDAETAVPFVRS